MKQCSYCGKSEKLTNEHVFPNFLDYLDKGDEPNDICTKNWLTRQNNIASVHQSAPTIKDVCKECNNGVLSDLDKYAKELTEKYFKKIIDKEKNDTVNFEFDYDKLLRWILKVTYNGSRAFGMSHIEYRNYLPYIMKEDNAPNEIHMFIGVMSAT